MKKLTEWRLAAMPIGTEVELIYEEDAHFLEKISGVLTNNDFSELVEITDSVGRKFILEYEIVREARINRRLETILWQTPPGAKVRFSCRKQGNRVPDREGTVVENDMDTYLVINTDRGNERYFFREISSFLVVEVPENAAHMEREGLSWRTPRDYLKLSDKALQDTFLLLPRRDQRKLRLAYDRFITATCKESQKELRKVAEQVKRIVLWEADKGYYWSSDAVSFCGSLMHLAGKTDYEIFLEGECFAAAALACWHQGLYTLGGAYAILSMIEENPSCTKELAIILAAGVIQGRDISGLDLLYRRMYPEAEPYLQQILEEAFHSCGMILPEGQSFQKSLEMLQPMFPAEDMAQELELWGENKIFRIMPGLQISRTPKLCQSDAVVRNVG